MKPRFAVEAHLADLFAQEATENEGAREEAIQHDNGGEQALVEPSPPCQLPPALDEALQEEVTTLNSQRHDWIERMGEPDRHLRHGQSRPMAD